MELSTYALKPLRENAEFVFYRGRRDADPRRILVVAPLSKNPAPSALKRLEHEYSLRTRLDPSWAVVPLALVREKGQLILVLQDPGGLSLDRLLERPLELNVFLRISISLANALGRLHERGLIHRDVKPANVMVDATSNRVWLSGFGIASDLPRERQAPEPPETIAGTLAYMAPEQTGRMNRSIDSRSDLYSLGVTLYELLTGSLPFTASDPMAWVHCHIARHPRPPGVRGKEIPPALSAIILKLLAKTAEERYQTAGGTESDLRRSLTEWKAHGCIDEFPLGLHDTPDRFLIPEKLYGRGREIDILLASFDRVVASGRPELVLVSGYPGIGKSSVVNELHKVLVPPRGLFASGKFDQYKREIPYSTLAQAFQGLIRPLLGKSDSELSQWRDALRGALDPNGRLIVDLVPELALILGEQPPVPELEPQDAQRRFQLVFRRFISVFARPEHPLALFLDDLQWLDAATLDLLEHLLTHFEVRYLLLVGAYRQNEVGDAHPLLRTLDAIRQAKAKVHEIVLAPLDVDDVGQLISDALHRQPQQTRSLAQLVHKKTAGNPFFAIQFLTALSEEGLVAFDRKASAWTWDVRSIEAKRYTENVVEFMAEKLTRLPAYTQKALQQLACLGNAADVATASLVQGEPEAEIHAALLDAVSAGLVLRQENVYTFVHDRVQEAAYALIPVDERPATHLRIGRVLAARTPASELDEKIFQIVSQLDRGAGLITERRERNRVAELNLIAGKRAKASTAYASALTYLVAGRALLGKSDWKTQYTLTFALEFELAECEFLTGDFAAAEKLLSSLSRRSRNLVDKGAVTRLKVQFYYTTLDQTKRAVDAGLKFLRQVGIDWSRHPTERDVRQEYDRISEQLGGRPIEALAELPRMIDPTCRAILDVLTAIEEPSFFVDGNLRCLITARIVNLSLKHGNSDGSAVAYVRLGWSWQGLDLNREHGQASSASGTAPKVTVPAMASCTSPSTRAKVILGARFGDEEVGFRFGQLGLDLVEKPGLDRFKARVSLHFAYYVIPRSRHIREGLNLLRRSLSAAQQAGDLKTMGYCRDRLVTFLRVLGNPLEEVQREAEYGLQFVEQAKFTDIAGIIVGQLALIRTLRGLTPSFPSFNDTEFDEDRFEQRLEADPNFKFAKSWYWICKLQARFYGGDYAGALAASAKAETSFHTRSGMFEPYEFVFYDALARAAQYNGASSDERAQHRQRLAAHQKQISLWAKNCPENFENRAALVGAEIARIEDRAVDAEHLYEQAIRSAHANGFVHNEALANEVAARFYATRGFEKIAHAYLRDARYCYVCWGATGKVRQLDELYPQLREREPVPGPTSTIGAAVEQLDLANVINVSQALSSEIVLEKLIDTLMRTAIEHAGAERGLLILPRNVGQRVEAEATTSGDTIIVHLREAFVAEAEVPESIVHYVMRTQENVILDDASVQNSFSADTYIRRHRSRSILCLPLINQRKVVGVLYLENNLTPRVFTPDRLAVLQLLASQAAISLENARLYGALRASEDRMNLAAEGAKLALWEWDVVKDEIWMTDKGRALFGIGPDERLNYAAVMERVHPEDRASRDEAIRRALEPHGEYSMEYRVVLPDGQVRWMTGLGRYEFADGKPLRMRGVSFDITRRKQAELEAAQQRRDLAHAARLTMAGELTASIAHELGQPLGAILSNAEAAEMLLESEPPRLEQLQQILADIRHDDLRASEVIQRMRKLLRKRELELKPVDLNAAALEVLGFVAGEAQRKGVKIERQLAENLPFVCGDVIHLQQVLMNLILNGIEAMSESSESNRQLTIRTACDGEGNVEVAVEDSGPGIPADRLPRLFESFFTTKPHGMGLGLSIVRSIVEAHGGRIWAENNRHGGACFRFRQPALDQSA